MEYRKLGKSGLDVSILGIGTNDFVRRTEFERVKNILHQCLDEGVNFIDTSNVYAEGRSEEFIGEILGKTPQAIVNLKRRLVNVPGVKELLLYGETKTKATNARA